jgi:hypothetical protein
MAERGRLSLAAANKTAFSDYSWTNKGFVRRVRGCSHQRIPPIYSLILPFLVPLSRLNRLDEAALRPCVEGGNLIRPFSLFLFLFLLLPLLLLLLLASSSHP